MKLVIPRERRAHERRVAATPDTVKKYCAMGFEVVVETGAGEASRFLDAMYQDAGASLESDIQEVYRGAQVILKVQAPTRDEVQVGDEFALLPSGALLIGMLAPYQHRDDLTLYRERHINAMALEFVPRITRAQSMDVLSSQSNLAGYRAVIEAANVYDRVMPMMMTAAGTVAPARVMVLGAGVAGLQAIATAHRLGAIVSATDVRPAAKEQVESLGAKFVMVESDEVKDAETAGGYAKEMSEDFKRQQAALVADTIKKQDMVITTALIPGRPAPELVSEAMVRSMRPGSVIVDLAVEQGGNCALSKPGETVEVEGVSIVGQLNMPSRLCSDASALYAKNVLNYLSLMINTEGGLSLDIPWDDDIVAASALTRDGNIIHSQFKDV